MSFNKEIPIKWEALPVLLGYVVAYMVVKALCQEYRLAADVTQVVLQVSAGVLAVAFIVHAMRIPRSPRMQHLRVTRTVAPSSEQPRINMTNAYANLLDKDYTYEDDL